MVFTSDLSKKSQESMSESVSIPYVLKLKEAVRAIHLSEVDGGNRMREVPQLSYLSNSDRVANRIRLEPLQPNTQILSKEMSGNGNMDVEFHSETPAVINYIYEVVYPEQLDLKPPYNMKRGRPKKKKAEEPVQQPEPVKVVKSFPRSRSGRPIKYPKQLEKDFTKADPDDSLSGTGVAKTDTSTFVQYEKEPDDGNSEKNNKKLEQLVHHQRRRKIASQYRCPKCNKAYLGKTKMMQHIKKNPDHGPLPVARNELNFEVWNYLVDITQKCPPAQRGMKFCEELTNLLHNVLLLTSALFKEVESNKNHVEVDKVLGNAIGLPPGQYKFNDSELYKDVTVLKLITNIDFFKPVSKTTKDSTSEIKEHKEVKEKTKETISCDKAQDNQEQPSIEPALPLQYPLSIEDKITDNFTTLKVDVDQIETPDFSKKSRTPPHLTVHQDLLSENALLNLPNLRDELMLPAVDAGGTLLDNSTSSDEVMNVDQFVNERFKKITEPEIDIGGNSLNLDLPSLDLFQFHTS